MALQFTLDESMDPDLEIPSWIPDPNLKPLQPLYVDGWASLHVNMILAQAKGTSSIVIGIKIIKKSSILISYFD